MPKDFKVQLVSSKLERNAVDWCNDIQYCISERKEVSLKFPYGQE